MIRGPFCRVFALVAAGHIALEYFVTSTEHNAYLLYFCEQWLGTVGANVLVEAYVVKSREMKDTAFHVSLSMGNSWGLFLVKEMLDFI